MPRLLATVPDVPLMQVSIILVRRQLAISAIRRTAMIVDIGMLLYDGREHPFIDIARGEVGLAEIRLLIGVIQLEVRGFGELIVYMNFIDVGVKPQYER